MSGRPDYTRPDPRVGVAIAVTDRVASQIKELTAEVKHIVRLQIPHSLGVVSFIALTVKIHFYTKLSSVIIPGEFNIDTVTCREGYEACICLLGSEKFPKKWRMLEGGSRNWMRDDGPGIQMLVASRRRSIISLWMVAGPFCRTAECSVMHCSSVRPHAPSRNTKATHLKWLCLACTA